MSKKFSAHNAEFFVGQPVFVSIATIQNTLDSILDSIIDFEFCYWRVKYGVSVPKMEQSESPQTIGNKGKSLETLMFQGFSSWRRGRDSNPKHISLKRCIFNAFKITIALLIALFPGDWNSVYWIRFCEHSANVVFHITITVCYMECSYFIKNSFFIFCESESFLCA